MDDLSRPPTAHKSSRKVPGSFDDAGISPIKDEFADSLQMPKQAVLAPSKERMKPENIPPLRPPTQSTSPPPTASTPTRPESSYLDGSSVAPDSFTTEQVLRNQLQDVESSFVAPISPIPTITKDGVDDTFVFDSPTKSRPTLAASSALSPIPASTPASASTSRVQEEGDASQTGVTRQEVEDRSRASSRAETAIVAQEPASDAAASNTDASRSDQGGDDSMNAGNTTASLEAFSSSPTAAATARTISRAFSAASISKADDTMDEPGHDDDGDTPTRATHEQDESRDSLAPPDSLSESQYSTTSVLRRRSSGADFRKPPSDAGSTPGHMLRYGKRPKFLQSRNASQRSSISSSITNDDVDSDVTVGLGVDYALQSGGAVSSFGPSRSVSNMSSTSNLLSRSISMGSIMSGIDDFDSSGGRLETLNEHDRNMTPPHGNDDVLRTPKAKGPLAPPTDTVLARHIRNVQVPDSLAQEYKTKGGFVTPRKPSELSTTSTVGTQRRGGSMLTLKEQSSTIERLSKENFDLKLKVMFLSERLDKLSEEGVKEVIEENVQLRVHYALLQRDNKVLRKRVKELERQKEDEHDRPSTARSQDTEVEAEDPEAAAEREEELIYLRERVEEYQVEIEKLRRETMTKEAEKRRMAETVKTLQNMGENIAGENIGRQEEEDVWKDLLEQETSRRESADEEIRILREENYRLKQESAANRTGTTGLHHTTNIYNITKKNPQRPASPSRPQSAFSGEIVSDSAASTLVEDMRKDMDLLRHENGELRREVGAQTSMLTSRNKEKERLYQEIEDLKLAQRRGGPAHSTLDSILDRSASQLGARDRPGSRQSGGTRAETAISDAERDELESKNAELRDRINEVKLENQTLRQEVETCREQVEATIQKAEEEYHNSMEDLMAIQADRDNALKELMDVEARYKALEEEAQGAIDEYEDDITRLAAELEERTENFTALQEEMRKLSEALVGLEDEQDNKLRRIQQLEQNLDDANKELEELEGKLLESNEKAQRLQVQQENSQGEIAFLREEQEGDKVRISELEVNLTKTQQELHEETERGRQMEKQMTNERAEFEKLSSKEKKEVQHYVNELNREVQASKDESRKLRKALGSREVEANVWKERLMELESNLREAVGDLNGTRSSLLKSIAQLQRDVENTARELDATRTSLAEKDRIIKQRDGLLESHALEHRALADALNKEEAAHRMTRNQFETFQKTNQHVTRTNSTQEARILELESIKTADKRKLAMLESQFKEQLNERNSLLLQLWTRLSTLCGSDWAHNNSLINGRALPSLEAVATMLPGFSKNLLAAVRTIESIVSGFQTRIKGVERDLWREYQTLESHLEERVKRLGRVETVVRNGVAAGAFVTPEVQSKIMRLEESLRQLQVENTTLRSVNDARHRAAFAAAGSLDENGDPLGGGSPSPNIPTGPRSRPKTSRAASSARSTSTALTRPMTAAETALQEREFRHDGRSNSGERGEDGAVGRPLSRTSSGRGDQRWIVRLKEMEGKLKMEREGRLVDRETAGKRLREGEAEMEKLRREMERERERRERGL